MDVCKWLVTCLYWVYPQSGPVEVGYWSQGNIGTQLRSCSETTVTTVLNNKILFSSIIIDLGPTRDM